MKKLILVAFFLCSFSQESVSMNGIPGPMQTPIGTGQSAIDSIANQCIWILRTYGAAGIEIVKAIISQVPEYAEQIIEILKKTGITL